MFVQLGAGAAQLGQYGMTSMLEIRLGSYMEHTHGYQFMKWENFRSHDVICQFRSKRKIQLQKCTFAFKNYIEVGEDHGFY